MQGIIIDIPKPNLKGVFDQYKLVVDQYTNTDQLIEVVAWYNASKFKNYEVFDDDIDMIVMSYTNIKEALVNAVRICKERKHLISVIVPLDENNLLKIIVCDPHSGIILLNRPSNHKLTNYMINYGSVFNPQFIEFKVYDNIAEDIQRRIQDAKNTLMNPVKGRSKYFVTIMINGSMYNKYFNTIEEAIVEGLNRLKYIVVSLDIVLKEKDSDEYKYLFSIESNGIGDIDKNKDS